MLKKRFLFVISLVLIVALFGGLLIGCVQKPVDEPGETDDETEKEQNLADRELSDEDIRAAEVVIDMAIHPLPFYQQSVRAFIDHVESASGGRIKVRTYTFPGLGSHTEVVELVSFGEVHMSTAMTDGALATMMPSSQATSLPFLITDSLVFNELMNGPFFFKMQAKMLEESGNTVRVLGMMKSSLRHLYTTKGPIRTPSDLVKHNIKMRVMEAPFYIALWGGLGTETIAITAAERYQALSTGIIDGLEGALMSAWQAGLMEVCKYATLSGHTFGSASYIINEEFFQGLPRDLQDIVVEGSRRAVMTDNGYIPLSSVEATELMLAAGVEIIVPTAAELEQWREIAIPIGRQFLEEEIDPEFIQELIDAVAEIEARFAQQRDAIAGR